MLGVRFQVRLDSRTALFQASDQAGQHPTYFPRFSEEIFDFVARKVGLAGPEQ